MLVYEVDYYALQKLLKNICGKIQERMRRENVIEMETIKLLPVQEALNTYIDKPVYLHLETTNGAYAAHRNEAAMTVSAFIRNGQIQYSQAKITGEYPYRVGLKLDGGWVYAQGLTDYERTEGKLLLAGHDLDGRLAIALQISEKPFK